MAVDSNPDKQRVVEAIRRGWVRQDQVEECVLTYDTADSIIAGLARRGWLTTAQVRELCGHEAGRVTQPESGTAGAYGAKAAALGRQGRLSEGRACLRKGLAVMPGNALLSRAMERF